MKGLPDQLAFLVRAGDHSDSANKLAAAKMGEAYGYRKDNVPLVPFVTKSAVNIPVTVKDINNYKTDVVSELQCQINSLTHAVSKLAANFPQQLDCTRDAEGNNHFSRSRNRDRQVQMYIILTGDYVVNVMRLDTLFVPAIGMNMTI